MALLLIIIILVSILTQQVKKPNGMTAEETIKLYFEYWNAKNNKGMDSLIVRNRQGSLRELNKLNSVTLHSCTKRPDQGGWHNQWYKNPYDVACLDVSFTVDYEGGSGAGFSNGTYQWQYYLVKPSAKEDWVIVQWGTG